MLCHIISLKPHPTKYTVSLNSVRNTILAMSRPLAEISRTIESCIAELDVESKRVFDKSLAIRELSESLRIPFVDLVATPLPDPRTVCADPKCTRVVTVGDEKKIDYTKICCPRCDVSVDGNQLGSEALRHCEAMDGETCRKCGCSWKVHIQITYETKRVTKKIISPEGMKKIQLEKDSLSVIAAHKDEVRRRSNDLAKERKKLYHAIGCCANFLRKHAIAQHNDSVLKYLEYCRASGVNEDNREFEQTYIDPAESVERLIHESPSDAELEPDKMDEMLQDLYKLTTAGPMLMKVMQAVDAVDTKAAEKGEKVYTVRRNCSIIKTALQSSTSAQ